MPLGVGGIGRGGRALLISRICAIVVLVLCVVERSWVTRRPDGNYYDILGTSAMKGVSALGLVICSAGILLLGRKAASGLWKPTVACLGAAVLALGAATLFEHLLDLNFGIDGLLARGLVSDPQQGRISATSAYCFILAGAALFVGASPRKNAFRLPMVSAFGVVLIIVGCFNLVGHIAEDPSEFSWWSRVGMAMSPAFGFTLIGVGFLGSVWTGGDFTWSVDRRVSAGFFAGLVVMLIATGISYDYTNYLRRATDWVSHTQEVITLVQNSRASLTSLMEGQLKHL